MTSSQSHNHDPAYLRDARREDIPTILQIITPYVEQHVLMPRDANDLEKTDTSRIRWQRLTARLLDLLPWRSIPASWGEIQCLAVKQSYQEHGLGKQLGGSLCPTSTR